MPGTVYGKFLAFVVRSLEKIKPLMLDTKVVDKRKVFSAFSCLLSVYLTMITGARISEAVAMALDTEPTKANHIYTMHKWHQVMYASYSVATPNSFVTKTNKSRSVYFFPVPKSEETTVRDMLKAK